MGKYLLLWEADNARIVEDAKERGAGLLMLTAMVKQDLQKGIMKDWGEFVGEANGYIVAEGTEVEIGKMIQQYAPFITFKTRAVGSLSQLEEVLKALSG